MRVPDAITADKLAKMIGTPRCPTLLDVRAEAVRAADPRLVPAARALGEAKTMLEALAQLTGNLTGPVVAICAEGHRRNQGVAALLRNAGIPAEYLEGGQAAGVAAGFPLVDPGKITARDAEGRTVWVTRARPKIDRIACPWLIRRFVDPRAIFLYVPLAEVVGVAELFGAMPYDIEDVFWSHRGELCTFDTMLDEFGLSSPALDRLAAIVRGADTARLDLALEAAGLLAASLGLSRIHADDLQQLEAGMPLYDAFYRLARDATDETHNGPAGQIAVMHRILVEEKRWLGDGRFLHALNFCMLLPGPEAQQLAVYIGWLLHGTWGGVIAGILFVLPGVIAIMALSWVYVIFGNVGFVAALFIGPKAAVLAIMLQAVFRVGRRALKNDAMRVIAALSFVAVFAFDAPFPLIVLVAALIGFLGARAGRQAFAPGGGHGSVGTHIDDAETLLGAEMAGMPAAARRAGGGRGCAGALARAGRGAHTGLGAGQRLRRHRRLLFEDGGGHLRRRLRRPRLCGAGGGGHVWLAQARRDARRSRDGGDHARAADHGASVRRLPRRLPRDWLGQRALGRHARRLLATWVTFAPCFAFIFLGAPYMEGLRSNRSLSAALTAVTASVVGVILNLAIWFAIHVVWTEVRRIEAGLLSLELPIMDSIDWAAAALSALALIAVFRLKLGLATVLGGTALLGLGLYVLGLMSLSAR